MNEKELEKNIKGCRAKNRNSQKAIFMHFYAYGISISRPYCTTIEDAEEITNDAFFKVFKHINKYTDKGPFALWLRRIVINTSIDHYRKANRNKDNPEVKHPPIIVNNEVKSHNNAFLMHLLDSLTPQYKLVFVMHVIEGFSHKEIAEKLKITIGTSKSNLSKARAKLKAKMVQSENLEKL